MWEDERKKAIIKNIVLVVLILIFLAALIIIGKKIIASSEEQDAQLTDIQAQQQKEQAETRQEALSAIQDEYDKDLDCVKKYLPGIVCWGDSITMGSSGSTSYPYILQKYIDTYICDIYDFRSTIINADDYSRLVWDDYKVSIPVVNMGGGPENSATVLGRAGVKPFVIKKDMNIPATTDSVQIELATDEGVRVNPLTGGDAGLNPVTVDGINGNISIDSSTVNNTEGIRYTFSRLEPGEEVHIAAGAEIRSAATDDYKNYIHIVCIGTYGGYKTVDELVEQTKALISRQTENTDRFLVLSIPNAKYYTPGMDVNAIDTAMMQAFGNKYLNIRKYLCSDGHADAKINMTSDDSAAIRTGAVPPSFLITKGKPELNGKADMLIGKLIFNQMESLGYFDEIYDELMIRETMKNILKEEPNYFNNMMKYLVK